MSWWKARKKKNNQFKGRARQSEIIDLLNSSTNLHLKGNASIPTPSILTTEITVSLLLQLRPFLSPFLGLPFFYLKTCLTICRVTLESGVGATISI